MQILMMSITMNPKASIIFLDLTYDSQKLTIWLQVLSFSCINPVLCCCTQQPVHKFHGKLQIKQYWSLEAGIPEPAKFIICKIITFP